MPVAGGPFIQKTGILLEVDAANAASYPGTGTTWANLFRPGTYNGTLTGSITYNSADAYGALQFPANNSYVDFGNIGDLSVSWSFQVAVKPAPSASGNYTILSYTSGSGSGSLTFKLDYSSSNQVATLSSYSVTGSTQIVHRVSGSIPTGSWSIINASYGSTVIGMFVNGRPTDYALTTGSTVGYSANNKLVAGGTNLVTSSYYSGSLASLLVYNADVVNTRIVQNYNAFATRFGLPPSNLFVYATDPDAFKFIEVANITSSIQATAVNSLVIGLKSANLWNKMQAIYPIVGGNAFSHKWNLKNPADTNNAYRIVWSGAVQHDSTGVEFLGGFGNTNFAPFTALTNATQSNHITMYNNKATLGGGRGWGLITMGNTTYNANGMSITVDYASQGFATLNAYNATSGTATGGTSPQNRLGLFVATRTDTNQSGYYQRGGRTSNASSTSSPTASPKTVTIYVGGENGDWGAQYGQMAFASLGTGLTQTDVDNLYTIVQSYQTTLGRSSV